MLTERQIDNLNALDSQTKVDILLTLASDLDLLDNKGYSDKNNIPLRTVNWQVENLKLPTLAIGNKKFIICKK